MRSINGVNQLLAHDQTIQMYLELRKEKYRYENHWRHRYYPHNRGGRIDRLSPIGNWLYGAAMTRFYEIMQLPDRYCYENTHRSTTVTLFWNGYERNIRLRMCADIIGIYIECASNSEFKPISGYNRWYVHSNQSFKDLNIETYFRKKILPMYLFPEGLFRNIQVYKNLTKAEALEWYKLYVKASKDNVIDIDKALHNRMKKKLNVELQDHLSMSSILNVLKNTPRFKKRTKMYKHPSPFELHDMYSSEYDDDDNMEAFINQYYSQFPKNATFI
jgi:hypothetical protein